MARKKSTGRVSKKRLETLARAFAATRKSRGRRKSSGRRRKSTAPRKTRRSIGRPRSAAWHAKWEKDFLAVATPKAKRDYFAAKRRMARKSG